jgi:hypothetical protein
MKGPPMERAAFWEVISNSRQVATDDSSAEAQLRWLREALLAMHRTELISFRLHVGQLMNEAYRGDLWSAASLIVGGCSNDCFHAFRGWLILQGKEVFYRVLAAPDSLADYLDNSTYPSNDEFFGVILEVYHENTGAWTLPDRDAVRPGELQGGFVDRDALPKSFPKLWGRFSNSPL